MNIQDLADAARVSFSTAWRWVSGCKPSPMGVEKLVALGLWIHVPSESVKGAA